MGKSLKSHKLTVTMHQDFTSGKVDATLRGIIGTVVPIIISQTVQPENMTLMKYSFYGVLYLYKSFGDRTVGQPQMITIEIYGEEKKGGNGE